MQRLALAVIFVALVAGAIALIARVVATRGRMATLPDPGLGTARGNMQKLSFMLLVALILYVSFLGAG